MSKYLLCSILLVGLLVSFSCKKETLRSPLASFMVVSAPQLTTTLAQGSNSQKITDIWFYVNDQFKGVYPIGGVMPIVTDGNATILMYAGIKNNGIAATRMPYTFYKGIEFTQYFESGKTYTISPTFEYKLGTAIPIKDDFDNLTGSPFYSIGDSAYTITQDPAKVYGGAGGSIFMSMSDTKPIAKLKTSLPIALPTGGAAVYLELNYKCNQSITVGVIGGGSEERGAITLNPSEDWNKIYIQLTNVVSSQPTYSYYDIYIQAIKEVNNPQIYLDNIKLVIE